MVSFTQSVHGADRDPEVLRLAIQVKVSLQSLYVYFLELRVDLENCPCVISPHPRCNLLLQEVEQVRTLDDFFVHRF